MLTKYFPYFLLSLPATTALDDVACSQEGEVAGDNLLCLPVSYTSLQAPALYNKNDRDIILHPAIEEVSDIDEIHHTVTYKMFLVLFWTDSRVVLRSDLVNTSAFVPTSLALGELLWLPDPDIFLLDQVVGFDSLNCMKIVKNV